MKEKKQTIDINDQCKPIKGTKDNQVNCNSWDQKLFLKESLIKKNYEEKRCPDHYCFEIGI